MSAPQSGTYPLYFKKYIDLVQAENLAEGTAKYSPEIIKFFESIAESKTEFSYAPGKWTIKELLQHLIDAERVFAYRALSIARRDAASLPGFDEEVYAKCSHANERSWKSLLTEFAAVRRSTDLLYQSFNEEDLQQSGITNGQPNTVIAIAYTTYGHLLHHKNVLEQKYLNV